MDNHRKIVHADSYHKQWNKGLTKETDPRIMHGAIALSKRIKENKANGKIYKNAFSSEFWTEEQKHT